MLVRSALSLLLSSAIALHAGAAPSDTHHSWRVANPAELQAFLPARATVEKERIETEMRTATGIIDIHRRMVAAVVLITAGYSADGKYSHYLLTQAGLGIGPSLHLAPGAYVLGWTRIEDGLEVRVFDASTGAPRGEVTARPLPPGGRIESFRIWAPAEKHVIQIGRFMVPYTDAHTKKTLPFWRERWRSVARIGAELSGITFHAGGRQRHLLR